MKVLKHHYWILIPWLFTIPCMSGCGGGTASRSTPSAKRTEEKSQTTAKESNPSAVVTKPSPTTPTAVAPANSQPESKPTSPTAADASPPPAPAESGDLAVAEPFRVNGEEAWSIVSGSELGEPYAIVVTPRDSSTFEVTNPTDSGKRPATPDAGDKRVTLLPHVLPVESAGWSADGLPWQITLDGNDPCLMALIPTGNYRRGSDDGPENTRPEQTYELTAFYMDVTEVTVERYEQMRAANQSGARNLGASANAKSSPQEPALGISYADAAFYARWCGKELPTEAQWEAAARGPAGYRYVWGNGRPLWSPPRKPGQISPVGSFVADTSPFGIRDLAGNAPEWCVDKYSPTAYLQASGLGKLREPLFSGRPEPAGHQVVRGTAPDWSIITRRHAAGIDRQMGIGFRCVVKLSQLTEPTATATPRERERRPPTERRPPAGQRRPPPRS